MNDAAPRTGPRDRLGAIGVPRESAFPDALRHTARVARLRRWIVWAASAIVGLVLVAVAFQSLRFLPADLSFARIALKGSRITIDNPKLTGYRKDGRPYELRARQGVQDITAPDRFELEGLEVRIENSADNVVLLSSAKGVYDAKHDHADLSGGVRIHDDRHFEMRLEAAAMDFKASVMTSSQPATLKFEGGEVAAKTVEFAQSERRATFAGEVHSVLYGGQDDDAAAPAAQPGK